MTDKTAIEAKIRGAIPYIMQAIDDVREQNPGTTIKLMVAAENPDGSGKVAFRMDTAEFMEDIAKLVGYERPSIEEKARFFVEKHGLTVVRAEDLDA